MTLGKPKHSSSVSDDFLRPLAVSFGPSSMFSPQQMQILHRQQAPPTYLHSVEKKTFQGRDFIPWYRCVPSVRPALTGGVTEGWSIFIYSLRQNVFYYFIIVSLKIRFF